MKSVSSRLLTLVMISASLSVTSVWAQSLLEYRTEHYFNAIKNSPELLTLFMQNMPKGGDLHNHESGATYAENLIKYAINDNLCVNRSTYAVLADSNCAKQDLLENAVQDPTFKDNLIDAWSMRHFIESTPTSGHDHFFAAFSKFGAITGPHHGEILAEIAQRAALENESYLELMTTADGNESGKLGKTLGWDANFDNMRAKLLANGFDKIVADATTNLNNDEAKMRAVLACDSSQPQAGCKIKIRYLYQVAREQAPEMVFAQILAGFEIASKDPRVVGLNMVQPEDGTISMRDYELQMQMIGYLHALYPNVKFSLHAGELNNVLVPADGLKFHIKDAIEVAHANRIGHGVDIVNEDNAQQTLAEMAQQHDLVEINLSSNAEILDIQGDKHPLPLYLQAGVPVTLSTDDEGVSRGNLTKEYERAENTYHFDYMTLKTFARNSLEYAFVSGQALWQDYAYQSVVPECAHDMLGNSNPSAMCKAFLDANEKAALQWNLENQFTEFETTLK